jgi:hypothetical protein
MKAMRYELTTSKDNKYWEATGIYTSYTEALELKSLWERQRYSVRLKKIEIDVKERET